MYKLAGVEAWEGMLGSYDIQTLVRQPPIERGIYRWRHDQRCYEVKERRGEQPSPHAAAVAFVTFGFGSAENVC